MIRVIATHVTGTVTTVATFQSVQGIIVRLFTATVTITATMRNRVGTVLRVTIATIPALILTVTRPVQDVGIRVVSLFNGRFRLAP